MNIRSIMLCTLLTINTGTALSLPGQTWCSNTYNSLRYALTNMDTEFTLGGLGSFMFSALCLHLYQALGAQEDQLVHESIENYDATVAELQNQAADRNNFYETWHVDIEALYRQSGISPETIKQLGSLRHKETLYAALGIAIPAIVLSMILKNISYLSSYYKSHELGQESSLIYPTSKRLGVRHTIYI